MYDANDINDDDDGSADGGPAAAAAAAATKKSAESAGGKRIVNPIHGAASSTTPHTPSDHVHALRRSVTIMRPEWIARGHPGPQGKAVF